MGERKPNDPKLSDGRGWRGPCMAGGKVAAEAGAVTAAPVRCSAWLGVSGRIGNVGADKLHEGIEVANVGA